MSELRAPVVRVEPAGVEIAVKPGQTLFDAAYAAGHEWPTTCWGQGSCSVCYVEVLSGDEHLSPADDEETRTLGFVARRNSDVDPDRLRLACRLEVLGDAVVSHPTFRSSRGEPSAD
jgi:2Fe-2S ferredoxin